MRQSLLHARYRDTLNKYLKYKTRLDKAFRSGRFKSFSQRKQHELISRVEGLRKRLASLASILKVACGALMMGLLLQAPAVQGQDVLGTEFQINETTLGYQDRARTAMDDDGDFAITWMSQEYDNYDESEVYVKVYRNDGTEVTGEIPVGETIGYYEEPSIAMDSDGDFAVTWISYDSESNNRDVYVRLFDTQGDPKTGAIRVDDGLNFNKRNPDIAMDADGDFVVVWQSFGQDGANGGIYAKRFDKDGNEQSGEFLVNTYTANTQTRPAVAMDADGDFVVTWQSLNQDGNSYGVYYKKFSAAGVAFTTEDQLANRNTFGRQSNPDVAMDADGEFVITWHTRNQYPDTDDYGVFFAAFDAEGTRLNVQDQIVNTRTELSQRDPSIAMDSDGDFFIAWNSQFAASDPNRYDSQEIVGQQFDRNCNMVGGEVSFPEFYNSRETGPSVAMDADGDMVISWSSGSLYSDYPDGSLSGSFGVRFEKIENPDLLSYGGGAIANDITEGDQLNPSIASDKLGNHVIAWVDRSGTFSTPSDQNIVSARFDGKGNKLDSDVLVSGYGYYFRNPAVAMDSDGDYVITYHGEIQASSGYAEVYFTRFDAAGTLLTAETRVSDVADVEQTDGAIAVNDAGEFVIAWTQRDLFGANDEDVYVKKFDADGNPITGNLLVNTVQEGYQRRPSVDMNEDGDFVVAWEDNEDLYAYYQRFDSVGVAVGPNVQVSFDSYQARNTDVKLDEDGDLFMVYVQEECCSKYISLLHYDVANTQVNRIVDLTNGFGYGHENPDVELDQDGDIAVAWTYDADFGTNRFDIMFRRFDAQFNAKDTDIVYAHKGRDGQQNRGSLALNKQGDLLFAWQESDIDESESYGIVREMIKVPQLNPQVVFNTDNIVNLQEDGSDSTNYSIELDFIPEETVFIELVGNEDLDFGNGVGQSLTLTYSECSPQTITVKAAEDPKDEDDVEFTDIQHLVTSTSGLYDGLETETVSIGVEDNDTAAVVISDTNFVVNEGEPTSFDIRLATIPVLADLLIELNEAPPPSIGTQVDITVSSGGDARIDLGAGFGSDVSLEFEGDSTAMENQTIPVTVFDNAIVEGDSVANLTLSIFSNDLKYDVLSFPTIRLDIQDNDSAIFVLTDPSLSRTVDEFGKTDSLQWSLTSIPSDTVRLTVTPESKLDVGGGLGVPFEVVFPPDSSALSSQLQLISTEDDFYVEGPEVNSLDFTIRSTDPNYDGLMFPSISVNIEDNDTAQINLSIVSEIGEVSEAGLTDTLRLSLASMPYDSVLITATPDSELDLGNGAGVPDSILYIEDALPDTELDFVVRATDDFKVDGDHAGVISFSVQTLDTNYAPLSISDQVFTILDNDSAQVIIIETGGETLVEEGGDSDSLFVSLSSVPSDTVFVTFEAPEGVVFEPDSTTSTVLTFLPNETALDQVTLVFTAVDNANITGGGLFAFNFILSSPDTAYNELIQDPIEVVIEENDTAVVSFDAGGVYAVSEAGLTDTLTFELGTIPYEQVEIEVSPTGQLDAGNGIATPITLIFLPDSSALETQRVILSTPDDLVEEGTLEETLQFTITTLDTNYATITVEDASVTLIDDDAPAFILFESDGETSFLEGTFDTYTIALTTQPTDTVFVEIASFAPLDLGQGEGTNIVLEFLPDASSLVAQTVTIQVEEDAIIEGVQSFVLEHSVTTNDTSYNQLTVPSVAVSLVDNDTASIELVESLGTSAVVEGGAPDSVNISLGSIPYEAVSIVVIPDGALDLGAGAGVGIPLDFSPDSSALAVQTLQIVFTENTIIDTPLVRAISFSVTTDDTNYAALSLEDLQVSLTDNDVPAVLLSSTDFIVEEGGATDTFFVSLQTVPSDTVFISFDWNTDSVLVTPSVLTFLPDTSALQDQQVVISAVDDEDFELNQLVTITYSLSGNDASYAALEPEDLVVDVTDNDAPLVPPGITVENGGDFTMEEGGVTRTISINLESVPFSEVTIQVVTPDRIGINGNASAETLDLVFEADSSALESQSFDLQVTDDFVDDVFSELAIVSYSVSSLDQGYDTLEIADSRVNMIDNDTTVVEEELTLNFNLSLQIVEGGEDNYILSLSTVPTDTVFVTISPSEHFDLGSGFGADTMVTFPPNSQSITGYEISVMVRTFEDNTGNFECPIDHFTESLDLDYDELKVTYDVEIIDPSRDVELVQVISPNGDGVNEYLSIMNIEDYPVNEVYVFDAHGNEIFKVKGYDNSDSENIKRWNGTDDEGDEFPEGVYYVVVIIDGVKARDSSGFVVLKR